MDPVGDPGLLVVAADPHFVDQIQPHPEIVHRVDVAGDDVGKAAHPRPRLGAVRQQGRLRIGVLKIFHDRHGLNEHGFAVDQGGHQLLRVKGGIFFGKLLAAVPGQVDRALLVVEALEIEGDARAVGGA